MGDERYPTADWQQLGFRCGLEIHHQILTERKLFCRCPAGQYRDDWHAEVVRHMRPTLSELGEYDGTALMEFKTKKEIVYRLHRDTVCTYELDDTPPFLVNQEAVDIALTIALAFNCKIVGELHIIRKQYLDGSIPTGFQRTTIVGVDGELPLSSGKVVKVVQLGLEEDACREISDVGHKIIFMTDRLSMPLIEVVTASELETPEEAAEAAERIGRLLRATGMVRRGGGAGREDVNVSISGSTRVEIKGVPSIARIPELTGREALRQNGLLKLSDEIRRRGLPTPPPAEELAVLLDPDSTLSRPEPAAALRSGDAALALRLPGAAGLLSWELGPGRTFGDDVGGRVRVIACLESFPPILHTDEGGGLDRADMELLRELLKAGDEDAVVLVWGPEEDLWTAAREVRDRLAEAFGGVPNETRQALRDNTTDFERVLPGPDRMYPDTDSPPTMITDERVQRARERMPVPPWEREERYRELGLPEDVVQRLAIDPAFAPLFDRLAREEAVEPVLAGEVLTRLPVALARAGVAVEQLGGEHYEALLRALGEGRIFREGVPLLLETWADSPGMGLEELLDRLGWEPLAEEEVLGQAREAVARARRLPPRRPETLPRLAMGEAMGEAVGRVPGARMLEAVRHALNDAEAQATK